MSKNKIILISIFAVLIVIISCLASLYFIQQKKLTVSYIISQSRGPENWTESICSDSDCWEMKAKKYKYSGSEYYDEIVEFDEFGGDSKQFAFRTSTGWNNMTNIEIGRIELPYADKNASVKCSFNYRGDANWQPCTEKQFLKSLSESFLMKMEKGKKYEEVAKSINDLEKDCASDNANYFTCMSEYSKLERDAEKLLKELRNATIQLK